MKAVVAAFNQEKALVGAFSVITNLRMELFQALMCMQLSREHEDTAIVDIIYQLSSPIHDHFSRLILNEYDGSPQLGAAQMTLVARLGLAMAP